MNKLLFAITYFILSSCSWHRHICEDSNRCAKYQEYIKTHKFKHIGKSDIPDNSVMVRAGDRLQGDSGNCSKLICRKTQKAIGCQWYDFGDGSEPGVYYIVIPTKREIRRYRDRK